MADQLDDLRTFVPQNVEHKTILHFLRVADYNRDVIRTIFDKNDVPGAITLVAYVLAMLETYHNDVKAAFDDAYAALVELYPQLVMNAQAQGAPKDVPLVIIPETGYADKRPVLELTPEDVAMVSGDQTRVIH